jgi:hypothetical protein
MSPSNGTCGNKSDWTDIARLSGIDQRIPGIKRAELCYRQDGLVVQILWNIQLLQESVDSARNHASC